MPRIPDELITRIKCEVPLTELCREYGIELKPKGKDFFGVCPFHTEDTPSFSVTPSRNLWNCLGACGGGGDNIQLVMKCEKLSFWHAANKLAVRLGAAPPVTATIKTRMGKEHPVLIDPAQQAGDSEVLSQVVDFYHKTFLNQAAAMQYLQKRGVFHPEAVKQFKIGYANRTLGYRIPATTQEGQKQKAQLQRVGILRESGHEHLSGCVVFPVWEQWPDGQNGRITEIYGRRITKTSREAPPHLYLPGPHHGVWNTEGVRAERVWILCESIIDALSFWVNGWHHVTASFGANGFTPDHWRLLRAYRPDKIIICYDNDDAGNRAAHELAPALEAEGVEGWRIELAPGTDVNDVVRTSDDPKGVLGALLAGATRLLPPNVPPSKPAIEQELALPPEPVQAEEVKEPETSVEKERTFPLAADPSSSSPQLAPVFSIRDKGTQAEYADGERSYLVRGLENNTSFENLKVNVRLCVARASGAPVFFFETFDLYNARARTAFVLGAHQTTGVEKAVLDVDLNQIIGRLQTHQETMILQKMHAVEAAPMMTAQEEAEAMTLAKHPRFLDLVLADLHKLGMVGEDINLLIAWLVGLSRKMEKPLGVCVMSRSAAGKSSLLETIGKVIPDEDKHQYTALTPQALFHMPENALCHKALFVAEDVGAEGAAYSLKTLQSDGKLLMACTVKDEETGQMVAKTKLVRGPAAIFLTSTRRAMDDELLNRLFVLSIDESAEQTRRIHHAQRYARSLEGIMEKRSRSKIIRRQQNFQRLIRPLLVRNMFRDELEFKSTQLRARRDNEKYLALMEVVALVHQYQREIKSATDADGVAFQFIDVTRQDVELVGRLLAEVLDQTTDELTPASRRMLAILEQMAHELPLNNGHGPHRWTRREIRERTGWSDAQVRLVMEQLVSLEYVIQIGSGGRGSLVRYQLAESQLIDSQPSKQAPSNGKHPTGNGHAVPVLNGSRLETRTQFAESSQKQKCELPSCASSSLLAANKAALASSQSSRGGANEECVNGHPAS
jgi:hypothetical protein